LTAAGMPEPQAEAVTALLKIAREADFGTLATKADLAQVKRDLQREIAQVKTDLQQENAELRTNLAETKADILKWMFGMIAGAVVINVMTNIGSLLALLWILGH
jgi:ribosomal protein L29